MDEMDRKSAYEVEEDDKLLRFTLRNFIRLPVTYSFMSNYSHNPILKHPQ
jgi:hypothetical protein